MKRGHNGEEIFMANPSFDFHHPAHLSGALKDLITTFSQTFHIHFITYYASTTSQLDVTLRGKKDLKDLFYLLKCSALWPLRVESTFDLNDGGGFCEPTATGSLPFNEPIKSREAENLAARPRDRRASWHIGRDAKIHGERDTESRRRN